MQNQSSPVNDCGLMSLTDLCRELSISVATGRNWLKLGKLKANCERKGTSFFSREYVNEIKSDIENGKNRALKNRRNKKYVSGNAMYHSYVADSSPNLPVVQKLTALIEEKEITVTDDILCVIIAECAVQLILSKSGRNRSISSLAAYFQGKLEPSEYWFLIDDLCEQCPDRAALSDAYTELLGFEYTYEQGEDLLGLLYLSLKNIGSRKATGSYYTPTKIVQKLCDKLFSTNEVFGKDVLDPCCGTGNFILQLPSQIGYDQVYGNDMDAMSVKIARINYALKYDISDADIIDMHITQTDYLSRNEKRKYDFILGNPPWGYDFSDQKKEELRIKYRSAVGNNIESYDLFVEQALSDLKAGGVLSFVLPEAILNVKTHTPVREIMLACCTFQYIAYLGNAFDGVQCPSVILQAVLSGGSFCSAGVTIHDGNREYTVLKERKMDASCISFSMTDEEYCILEKMDRLSNKVTLAGNARFALGIVTGNNRKYISHEKTPDNEIVLKGSDLRKFRYQPSENYLVFKPESFQQTAPAAFYRAPEKLFYRFICNQLVFAYDDAQTLSLNSCNILIPEIPEMHMKYIMAVLNARAVQFYFKKRFHSVKVLRSHLEQIPIPAIETEAQNEITAIVDSILEAADISCVSALYDELDRRAAALYGITGEEYQIIKGALDGENLLPV